jgi:hypothetical protein
VPAASLAAGIIRVEATSAAVTGITLYFMGSDPLNIFIPNNLLSLIRRGEI